jgi:hypothetical protein
MAFERRLHTFRDSQLVVCRTKGLTFGLVFVVLIQGCIPLRCPFRMRKLEA